MKFRADTEQFEMVTGKKPRGRGGWMFWAGDNGKWTKIIAPANYTYTEAEKHAIREMRLMGLHELVLCH